VLARVKAPLHITTATRDRATAADWFGRFEGAGLDGVIAKGEDGTYEPNKRVMLKVKHERDCDCVVAGFRWHKRGEKDRVGSLLLGLYDDGGNLEHVGVCASFTDVKRLELAKFLAPYRKDALDGHPWRNWAESQPEADAEPHRRPGAQSRWSAGKDLSWEPLRPELVVEVAYDHMQGSRFRHTAQFRRWRDDKRPRDCTFDHGGIGIAHRLAGQAQPAIEHLEEALTIARRRDVTALFKTHQHSKDLRNGATEPPSHLTLGESSWLAGEEFQYVETLLQGRRWISARDFGFSSAHLRFHVPSIQRPLKPESQISKSSACRDIR